MIISSPLRLRPCLLLRLDELDGSPTSSPLGMSRTPFLDCNKKLHSKFVWRWAGPFVLPGTKEFRERGRVAAAWALSVSQAVHSDPTRNASGGLSSPGLGGNGSVWSAADGSSTTSSSGSYTVALTVFLMQEGALLNSPENEAPILLPEQGAYSHSENKPASRMLPENQALPMTGAVDTSCSEEEASLIEAEKLRRRKISAANKGKVPWNKGKSFTQGVLQSVSVEPHLKDMDENTSILVREKWRRLRISQANKGKVPWNKGRLHSEETKQRIKARTTEAMKDPKIREKLRSHGEAQSPETRLKIKCALLNMWNAKKKIKAIQESCVEQWQDTIAEMARRGSDGEVEYQWSSYTTLIEELRNAWKLAHIEERRKEKNRKLPKVNRSSEHRMKIAEAIKAKWADPNYRVSVQQGMHAYLVKRGVQPSQRMVRAPFKRTSSNTSLKRKPIQRVTNDSVDKKKGSARATKSEKKSVITSEPILAKTLPAYQNPLTQERLEKLKQMRVCRLSEQRKRMEVTERARILLAEANRAARALEAAAVKDKNALASLLETRRLLAEATRSFESAGIRGF